MSSSAAAAASLAPESDGLRRRHGQQDAVPEQTTTVVNEPPPAADNADEKKEEVLDPAAVKLRRAFNIAKTRLIDSATQITAAFEDSLDMLILICSTPGDSDANIPPVTSSLATRGLKALLIDASSKALISECLYNKDYDEDSVHYESSASDKKSRVAGNCALLLEQARELGAVPGINVILVVVERTTAEIPDLHIFATGMFRPLVVEGSPGRKRLIFEGSKRRIVTVKERITDYLIIMLFIGFLLFLIFIFGSSVVQFYERYAGPQPITEV